VDRTALVLVRASHLRNMVRFFSPLELQVYDLTTPGWGTSEVCPNEMLVIRPQHKAVLPLEETGLLDNMWGPNLVHPSS
jgi:hypothetical protein